MSNALAIAHVTQALALLIENNLRPEIDMAVSVETRKPPAEPPTDPTITVFLYQVTPNASLRNNDLPTRSSQGTLVKRPAAAMDLHYVISAYGEENELVGQRLIGCVVRTLHEIPILPADVIAAAGERPYLAGSDLADSEQRVRFTPTQLDIDETSKLWGMLHQTPYSLSVAYQGSLVLIEGREKPVPAKPVEEHTVRALPFGAPNAPAPPGAPGPAPAGTAPVPQQAAGNGTGDTAGPAAAKKAPPEKKAQPAKKAEAARKAEPPKKAEPARKAAAKTATARKTAGSTRSRKPSGTSGSDAAGSDAAVSDAAGDQES
ncbi:DUF4255 domain-containing protein [Streptomyces regalis]|uniref:Pvc16 N-terminal domain-containing protein n=1 Tax=Streptomyces regalis TaxID=68262 RepID=A0A101JRR7_9ACTN|nr:DUF4255 domain-containing protein [Streptomyces regalis]KUL31815.1 hypothetical protein ADL12_24320 [Streptomyces regalis]